MPRPHRYTQLPDVPLAPTKPIPDVPIEVQSANMRELRRLHNDIAQGWWLRDDRMASFASSNTVSREDMAVATGLVKSRVDQIIRGVHEKYAEDRRTRARERGLLPDA
jgi:hypothetical protein